MITKVLIPLALMMGLTSCSKHIDYVQSYYYNQKFKYYLKNKEYEKAQAAELASKENLQDHFELDSNLGVVFNLLSKNEESQKSFDEALKVIPQQFKTETEKNKALFQIYFNRGVFFQSQNKVDQALSDYQAALDLNPTSVETKTNIELLIQKQKEDQQKQGKDGKDGKDDKSGEDQKPQDKEGDKEDEKKEQEKQKDQEGKDRKQNSKYQPRPFKGDQLSEGDVKKILGELSQQDKKIRAQFDKKEKQESGIEGKNDKDW